MKKNKNIIDDFFNINDKIELNREEEEIFQELEEQIVELLEEQGTIGKPKIREIVLDSLMEMKQENIIEYLGMTIDPEIQTQLETKLNDESFLKIEEQEDKSDFFNKYLQDDTINDLINSFKGYDRKSEGSKEIFVKKRGCTIPTKRIVAINGILTSVFNKTSFLGDKEDQEQAEIILFSFKMIFDILLEINYECCDTQRTVEILSVCAVKLTNMIGISKGFRKELLEALKESYQSMNKNKESIGGLNID